MISKDSEIEQMAPWAVIVITLVGGFLRFYLLGSNGLLLDETFSIWIAQHPVPAMLQWISRIDLNPPLYYLLLHTWIGLNGDTPYYARQLSALFGAAAIPVIYLIGKRISGALMGLAAAVFLALSLFNIYLAHEARTYTFLTFNAAVAIYALVRLLTDPRSARPIGSQFREYLHAWRTLGPVEPDAAEEFSYEDKTPNQTGWRAWIFRHRWSPIQTIETDLAWFTFILFSAATLLSHNTAVFFIFAVNIFVLGLMLAHRIKQPGPAPAFQAPSVGNWLKAQIAIFLLWSPWLLAFIQQAGRLDRDFWLPRPGRDAVLQTLQVFLNPSAPVPAARVITWALYALLGLGLVYYRKKLSIFFFLAALFATPFLGELVVSIRRPIYDDRTLVWTTIPLFLVLAAGIAQLRFRLLMLAALGIIVTNSLFTIGDNFRIGQTEDWNDPAGYVANRVEKDDLILFNSAMVQIPFDYYFIPYEKKNYLEVEKHGVPDIFDSATPERRMTDSDIPGLISLLSGHTRVWLVSGGTSYSDPMGLVPQTLAGQMKLIQKRDFMGGQVQLYGTP